MEIYPWWQLQTVWRVVVTVLWRWKRWKVRRKMQSAVNMVNVTAKVVCVNVLIRGEVQMVKAKRVLEVIVVREIGDRVVILRNSGRMLTVHTLRCTCFINLPGRIHVYHKPQTVNLPSLLAPSKSLLSISIVSNQRFAGIPMNTLKNSAKFEIDYRAPYRTVEIFWCRNKGRRILVKPSSYHVIMIINSVYQFIFLKNTTTSNCSV